MQFFLVPEQPVTFGYSPHQIYRPATVREAIVKAQMPEYIFEDNFTEAHLVAKSELRKFKLNIRILVDNTCINQYLVTVEMTSANCVEPIISQLPKFCKNKSNQISVALKITMTLGSAQGEIFTLKDQAMNCSTTISLSTAFSNLSFSNMWYNPSTTFSGKICVAASIHKTVPEKLDSAASLLQLNKKILQTLNFTDAVIVASHGAEIPCHKSFLSAQSEHFHQLLKSGMQDQGNDPTLTLALDDVSEAGVRAMMNYIYCCDTEQISNNCEISLELLKAADKYGLTTMETEIKHLILVKNPDWFTVSVTLELWEYANKKIRDANNEIYMRIQEKAGAVLKTKPNAEIQESPAFQNLLERQSDVAEFSLFFVKLNI